MEEAELEKQRRMVTKSSSIKRKPLADLTNIARKPLQASSFCKSKKPLSSSASNSSIGSTQNPIHLHRPIILPPDQPLPSKPQSLTPDHLVGNVNRVACTQRQNTQNTRSKTKAAAPFHQTSFQETGNNGKEGYVSLYSSTLEKFKDQGYVNRTCLDKTKSDEKKIYVAPRLSSLEKINDKRKAIDVPLSAHNVKNAKNSINTPIPHNAMKIKDKGKENNEQSSHLFAGNAKTNMDITVSDSLMKRKDKGKAIAMDYPTMKKVKSNMVGVRIPLKGVIIKDREETVTGSSHIDLVQKDKGKAVVTPIKYRALEKKDKQSSCPPLLRTRSNRNESDGAEDMIQSKIQTEPPHNKKKRRSSSKEVVEEFALPQDFVEQQRAYFKEIDDFELLVEEV